LARAVGCQRSRHSKISKLEGFGKDSSGKWDRAGRWPLVHGPVRRAVGIKKKRPDTTPASMRTSTRNYLTRPDRKFAHGRLPARVQQRNEHTTLLVSGMSPDVGTASPAPPPPDQRAPSGRGPNPDSLANLQKPFKWKDILTASRLTNRRRIVTLPYSGSSTFLQRGSPPPPPWRLLPGYFLSATAGLAVHNSRKPPHRRKSPAATVFGLF
jgi:hypothetical protein